MECEMKQQGKHSGPGADLLWGWQHRDSERHMGSTVRRAVSCVVVQPKDDVDIFVDLHVS